MREPSRRISTIILVCATLACFGVVCSYGFTNAEDEGLITRNAMFNPPTLASLRQIWTTPHLYLYIPATYTAWWVLALIGQTNIPDESGATLNPWIYHSASFLMHVVGSLLVLQLLRRLMRGREGAALIGALVFAIHPLQTEAVAWTTGMKDTLCGVFSFAALWMYVEYATRRGTDIALVEPSPQPSPGVPGEGAMRAYVLATAFFVLAMLAKPAAVVVPLMAAIIDRLLIGRSWRAIARSTALWFVLAIPFVLIARFVQPASQVTPTPFWARPLVAMDALGFYLTKLALPAGLTINYERTPQAILASGAAYWMLIVPAVVAIIVWCARSRTLLAAALLFVAGVLPVLGLTTFLYQQYSTVADRFVYLSMLGPAVAVACLMSRRWTRATVTIAAVVLIALGGMSFRQALVWQDRLTLYRHAVAVLPDSATAHRGYAGGLLQANRINEAIEQLEIAQRLTPFEPARQLLEELRAITQPAAATQPTTLPQ